MKITNVHSLPESIISALKAALAEPVQDTGVKLKPVFYAPRRLDDEEIEAIVGKPVQEPPCATRECMPSQCPNCVSLQDQNTELDRKLAELEAALRAQS